MEHNFRIPNPDSSDSTTNPNSETPRVLNLSYSSRNTFLSCGRKFELQKLYNLRRHETNVHLSWGKAIGAGCADFIRTRSINSAIFQAFKAWDSPFSEVHKNKSFNTAVVAIEDFSSIFLQHYSAYTHIASELHIEIDITKLFTSILNTPEFPYDKVVYDGYVDAIVQTPTGERQVWEFKTESGWEITPDSYKKSPQTLWYFLALASAYHTSSTVVYPVVTASRKLPEWNGQFFRFTKTRADTIDAIDQLYALAQTLIASIQGRFLKNETNCYVYNRQCPAFAECGLSREELLQRQALMKAGKKKLEDKPRNCAEVKISLTDLEAAL